MSPETTLLEVHLLQFPVSVWGRAREHSESLQREFALMGMGSDDSAEPGGGRPVPARLLELVQRLRAQYASTSSAQEKQMSTALTEGREVLDDLVYLVPAVAADACIELGAMYDEADAYCREGTHLLTLTTPDDLLSFRRWFLGEFVRQLQGSPPTPWPAHASGD